MQSPDTDITQPKQPVSSGNDLRARLVALSLLDSVIGQNQTLESQLETSQDYRGLSIQDRSFCRMLVSTTLRRLGQIDDLIRRSEDKPGSASSNTKLQNILRLGITQLFFMNVADHAAVDTSVRLAEKSGMERQKGFVNAVLRHLLRDGKPLVEAQDPARLNTPEWLLKIWIEDYGLRIAAEIAQANLVEAPLDITVKDPDSVNYWGSTLQASSLSTGSLRRLSGGSVRDLPGFQDGAWWVQDASAALPAQLFGDLRGRSVIDMCAAPGGKTAQLAAQGAHVVAIDRSAQRIKRLHENLERLGLSEYVETAIFDAASWQPKEAPHFILLDAPCSATGTIRRHPDVPHLKTIKDIDRLSVVQERLLHHAFDILAPGGILIYCTCSLQKAEGEYQIDTFLRSRSDAVKIAFDREEVGKMDDILTEDGDIRIFPFTQAATGGMDGFFISRLSKQA